MTDQRVPVRGRRRGGRWTRVSHGLYTPIRDVTGPREELLAWSLVLPSSAVFTHLTAARELGWWLPPLPDDLPVFVCMHDQQSRPQRSQLRVTRLVDPPTGLLVNDVPLAPPAEMLLGCARDLRLLDMVVLTDAAPHTSSCARDELSDLAGRPRRGAPMLR